MTDNVITMPMTNMAISKLEEEFKQFTGGNYEKAVSEAVFSTVKFFVEQDNNFAETVVKTKRTLSDIVYESMKEWSKSNAKSVSDIDVYRAVVKNYYPNSEVRFLMTLELGDKPTEEDLSRETVKEEKKTKKTTAAKSEPKPAPAPIEPQRELTVAEKIELEIKRRKEAKDKAIKKALEEEKKKNNESGQIMLFDLF